MTGGVGSAFVAGPFVRLGKLKAVRGRKADPSHRSRQIAGERARAGSPQGAGQAG